MSYDYGRKHIAKMAGLTGAEAKGIAKNLEKQGLDYQAFDWKTIGEDLYGHGKRVGGVKSKLKSMYGVSVGPGPGGTKHEREKYSDIEAAAIMPGLMKIHDRRSPLARKMDLNIAAKGTFKPTDKRGVELWKKHPNQFDIIGIDDPI